MKLWEFLNNLEIGILFYNDEIKKIRFNSKAEKMFNITNKKYLTLDEFKAKLNLKLFSGNNVEELFKGKKIEHVIIYNNQKIFLSIKPVFLRDTKLNLYFWAIPIEEIDDMISKENSQKEIPKANKRIDVERFFVKNFNTKDYGFYSDKIKKIIRDCLKIAKIDSTVLITGESGVGKGVIAKIIHQASERAEGSLININCASIPNNLIEAELFGYEKGAFTGALKNGKPGLFEIAHGGTLFLDEIGDLPSQIQVKLLKAIQDKEIYRIGGIRPIKVDVRIIAATNRNLKQMLSKGTFREDLYYRLNVIAITIPPLRERKEDIKPLIKLFLSKYNNKFNYNKKIDDKAIDYLENYYWPGNIRELENLIQRMIIFSENNSIYKHDIINCYMDQDLDHSPIMPLQEAIEKTEKKILKAAKSRYKTTREMAEALKVSQPTIVRRLNKYGI